MATVTVDLSAVTLAALAVADGVGLLVREPGPSAAIPLRGPGGVDLLASAALGTLAVAIPRLRHPAVGIARPRGRAAVPRAPAGAL